MRAGSWKDFLMQGIKLKSCHLTLLTDLGSTLRFRPRSFFWSRSKTLIGLIFTSASFDFGLSRLNRIALCPKTEYSSRSLSLSQKQTQTLTLTHTITVSLSLTLFLSHFLAISLTLSFVQCAAHLYTNSNPKLRP